MTGSGLSVPLAACTTYMSCVAKSAQLTNLQTYKLTEPTTDWQTRVVRMKGIGEGEVAIFLFFLWPAKAVMGEDIFRKSDGCVFLTGTGLCSMDGEAMML